jgi:hypothetical protein
MSKKIYTNREKQESNRTTNVYYYKPKGYNKYISFVRTTKNTYGEPRHHTPLPDDAVEFTDINEAMELRIKFLDTCFSC